MQKLNINYLIEWYNNPVTKLVLEALVDRQNKENLGFIGNQNLNSEQYIIERNLYRLMGKNEVIKKLVDKDYIKSTLLRDYVVWENSGVI